MTQTHYFAASYQAGFLVARGEGTTMPEVDPVAYLAGYDRGRRPQPKQRCTAMKLVRALFLRR